MELQGEGAPPQGGVEEQEGGSVRETGTLLGQLSGSSKDPSKVSKSINANFTGNILCLAVYFFQHL